MRLGIIGFVKNLCVYTILDAHIEKFCTNFPCERFTSLEDIRTMMYQLDSHVREFFTINLQQLSVAFQSSISFWFTPPIARYPRIISTNVAKKFSIY